MIGKQRKQDEEKNTPEDQPCCDSEFHTRGFLQACSVCFFDRLRLALLDFLGELSQGSLRLRGQLPFTRHVHERASRIAVRVGHSKLMPVGL